MGFLTCASVSVVQTRLNVASLRSVREEVYELR